MENTRSSPAPSPVPPYPWYDDRVKAAPKRAAPPRPEAAASAASAGEAAEEAAGYTPREIYDRLDRQVWKQEAAKKAAAIIMYHCLHGGKTNALFIGPSGCGKTHIWRCLKGLYPDRIEITDVSNLTLDGWKGSRKWADLLCAPMFRSGRSTVLVLDEADKMLAPKFSGNENVSRSVQAEGLTLMEGARVEVKADGAVRTVDTSKISFVLCGAFSSKARSAAERDGGSRIGFGADRAPAQPYRKPLEEADLMEFGVMPEFLGRIQRIVNLEPMTEDDYYRMTDSSFSLLAQIREQYRADVRLTPGKRRELAGQAARTGLGVRGMENQIRQLMDDAIFQDCERRCFEF